MATRQPFTMGAAQTLATAMRRLPEGFEPGDDVALLARVESLPDDDRADAMLAVLADHLTLGGVSLAKILGLADRGLLIPLRRGKAILARREAVFPVGARRRS